MRTRVFFHEILIISVIFLAGMDWSAVATAASTAETNSSILYVKPGAIGDCASWLTPCEFQSALDSATPGDQIWVAAGTYKPTASSDRHVSFAMKSGVAIYGGFPADGGAWVSRNWQTNLTILSGDIGIIDDIDDNSYHVVIGNGVDAAAVLDGFTISGGNGDGSYPDNSGGGMYNETSTPTLTNVSFFNNSAADDGGGMYNETSNPTLSNVSFSNNSAADDGGGMYNETSNPILTHVTFSDNSAGDDGGGLNNDTSSPILTNVTFSDNSAFYGGGIFNGDSSPTLRNVTFSGNSVGYVGGGMCNSSSSPMLTNVTFYDNSADEYGGGMDNYNSSPTLTNITFSGNSAITGGGMFNTAGSNPSLANVTFSGNSAENGGGLYNWYSNPTLTNVTFSDNSTTGNGGGMYNGSGSQSTLINAILWSNTPNQIHNDGSGTASVTYSDIQGGYAGTGNINLAPLLGALADNGGYTLTRALLPGSPAIDLGHPSNCPATDQRGFFRPIDGDGDGLAVCDMGSYEYGSYLAFYTYIPIIVK